MEPNPLEPILPGVLFSRYLSVAALTVLLWDHCLTFEQERQLIWPSHANFVKRMFLCNRYIVPVLLLIDTHTQSGFSSRGLSQSLSCRGWTVVVCFSALVSVAISQWLILLKLWKLWDGRRDVMLVTTIPFFVTQVGSVIFMAFAARQAWPGLIFSKDLHMCALTTRPALLKGLWAWLVAFEVFVYLMICLNAWSQPRESHTLLIKVLYRDGIVFFLATTAMRVMNLYIAIKAAPSQIFLGIYCVWAMVTTIVSRMIINVREAELVMSEAEEASSMALTIHVKNKTSTCVNVLAV